MNQLLVSPFAFLIGTLFDLYILVVLLRFLLQWVRADFYNPVSQFAVRLTNPLLLPLRRFVPGWHGIDMAAVVLLLALQFVALLLLTLLQGLSISPLVLLPLSLVELLGLLFNFYLIAIIIQAVISWINPMAHYNPVASLLTSLTEPLLGPARRRLPPISGIDLSPLVVLLLLQVVKMLTVPPLQYLLIGGL